MGGRILVGCLEMWRGLWRMGSWGGVLMGEWCGGEREWWLIVRGLWLEWRVVGI